MNPKNDITVVGSIVLFSAMGKHNSLQTYVNVSKPDYVSIITEES